MMVCSSAKVVRSSLAMKVAKVEEAALGDGTAFGGYVMSRAGESGLSEAELMAPGLRWIVNAVSISSVSGRSSRRGASCRRR